MVQVPKVSQSHQTMGTEEQRRQEAKLDVGSMKITVKKELC